MNTPHELETAWKLFNLLEELSSALFDRYHEYLIDRHLDQEALRYFEDQGLQLTPNQSKQSDNLHNRTK